jgi:hypothetical protein
MSTDRETTRVVRSWLEDGVTRLPDRVLESVLDQVPATPQRRSWWPAWRSSDMNTYAKFAIAAAAVLAVAVVGYNFLPGRGGVGGPTAMPSPNPVPLAVGSFRSHGGQIELAATGEGSNVTGSMTYTDEGGEALGHFVVNLVCTRTTVGGLILIGGPITDSTKGYVDSAPVGSNIAMVLQRGSPVKAYIHVEHPDPHEPSCPAFLQSIHDLGNAESDASFEPISGTVELRP